MLKYVGKYKILYYSVCAVMLLILYIFLGLHEFMYFWFGIYGYTQTFGIVCVGLMFLLIIVWANICHRLANKSYEKRISLLNDSCDPEAFLKANEYSYKKALKVKRFRKPRHRVAAYIQNYHFVALIVAGRREEVMQAVELLRVRTQGSAQYSEFYATCLTNLAAAFIQDGSEGDIAAAKQYIEKAKELLSKRNVPGYVADEITRLEYRLDAVEGKNLQGCLEYFTRHVDNAAFTRAEVGSRNVMALIYRQLGDAENERAQLEIVAQKAQKMYIGKQAAQRLEELSAQ